MARSNRTVLKTCFSTYLQIVHVPKDRSVVLCEDLYAPRAFRNALGNLLLNQFQVGQREMNELTLQMMYCFIDEIDPCGTRHDDDSVFHRVDDDARCGCRLAPSASPGSVEWIVNERILHNTTRGILTDMSGLARSSNRENANETKVVGR